MVQLFVVLLLAAAPGAGIDHVLDMRDRTVGVTPVTDKFLLPPKILDCRNPQEEQQALAQRANGDQEFCDPVVWNKEHRRHRT